MNRAYILRAGTGLALIGMLLLFFLFSPGQTVQAFNKQNLIRVAGVYEVDGKVFYQRLAPVSDPLP